MHRKGHKSGNELTGERLGLFKKIFSGEYIGFQVLPYINNRYYFHHLLNKGFFFFFYYLPDQYTNRDVASVLFNAGEILIRVLMKSYREF